MNLKTTDTSKILVANLTYDVHIIYLLADFHIRRWRGQVPNGQLQFRVTQVDIFRDTLGYFQLFSWQESRCFAKKTCRHLHPFSAATRTGYSKKIESRNSTTADVKMQHIEMFSFYFICSFAEYYLAIMYSVYWVEVLLSDWVTI